jgi:uncharacterized alkaline shock family protein YloU
MPRTKVSRNGAKRNRKSSTDDKIQMQLRDLDSMRKLPVFEISYLVQSTTIGSYVPVEAYNCDIDVKCMQYQDDIAEMINMMRKKTPKNILNMTYADLKALEIKFFDDLTLAHDTNGTISSAASTLSIIMEKTMVTKKFSHDEGSYLKNI